MADPSRILIIRPTALGDVCSTVPALASLRRRYPEARIDWLVRDEFAPAVAAHPDLSNVVLFPRSALHGWWRRPSAAANLLRWLGELRAARYELVFDFQGLARSGAFARATGAPKRVGFADAAEFGWLGCNRRHRIQRRAHAVDRILALLEAEGVEPTTDLRLYTSEQDRTSLPESLRGARYAALAPTSRWPGKCWPTERYAQLAAALLDEERVEAVAVLGARGEREQCRPLLNLARHDSRVIDLVGATNVGGLLAVIEQASLVVANDSAAMHMAVGFDRPLVALLGPTDANLTGPYGRPEAVLQSISPHERRSGRAYKHADPSRELMKRIGVEEAVEAARRSLEQSPRAGARTEPPTVATKASS